jgi:pimeloyl-ACP methyl ester carboxylesterase
MFQHCTADVSAFLVLRRQETITLSSRVTLARTLYALLVGIDAYEAPVRPLRGCLNDIIHIETLLAGRAEAAGDVFHAKVLANSEAKRQTVIDGFRQHLRHAQAGDVALFYYSGHGSQEKSPPEFWHIEPDRLDETLVCHDSRQPGSWDLADKELAQLISEVAGSGAHVVVILDCCHSGSGTRNADDVGIRRVPTDPRERPLSAFLDGLQVPVTRSATAENESGWIELPKGRHILLAACRADEEAKEYSLGGKPHGVFSYYLGETLAQAAGAITYRELFKRVNALVRSHAALQSPQIEPTDHAMFDEIFLNGDASPRSQYFTLSHAADVGWVVDAGSVHGVPRPVGEEAAVFAIFPHSSRPEQWRDMKAAFGTARVQRVDPQRSMVAVAFTQGAPDAAQVYKAVLAVLPLPPFDVQLDGDAAGLAFVRAALQKAGPTGGASLLVRESARENAELRLVANADGGGRFRIMRPADGRRLVSDVEGFTADSASKAVERLEHIARWMRIDELSNPGSKLAGKVAVEIYSSTGDAVADAKPLEGTSLQLLYAKDEKGTWQRPRIKIKLTNRSDRTLHCALVGLTQMFAIQTGLLTGGSVRLEANQEAWANDGASIATEVPDPLWKAGVVEVRDVLKLIASTEEIDTTLLEQDELDHPLVTKGATRGGAIKSTLERLMHRVQTRAFSTKPAADEIIGDWTTKEFTFTTVRPLVSIEIPRTAASELYPGVRLLSHPTLTANARLTAAPVASRDVEGGFVLPPLLRDDPAVSEPFLFSSSRGGAPGLSVLELHDVENSSTVTPDQPLRLKIAQPLAPDEHLLPIGYDGEFFLLIGRGVAKDGGLTVAINALPQPQNTRSLSSAVRIYFQKVKSQIFGTRYDYPLLAAFDPGNSGSPRIAVEPPEVKAKVARAKRIVLYIHGIIGETRDMAVSSAGLAGPPPIPGLLDRYDLILTFDYENLNTSIEDNAEFLRERLAAVGLEPGHEKTLHIVAHSMGGLISRWFIERLGGNKTVQHLVMLGTPNGGSPWPTVEDWAVVALSFGLNNLVPIPWLGKILGNLVSAVEKIDVALDEMNPSSMFLTNLNASPDPKIPYTIIAGNTSLIAQANIERERACRSLLGRLRSLNLLHLATAPAFFGKPNDIAVSVANIRRQPAGRSHPASVREVACDHLTYFNTQAGLSALAELMPPVPTSS